MMTTTSDAPKGQLLVPPDTLAAGVIQAQAARQSLREISALKGAATALIEAATSIGCCNLVATNAAAESLATAAALMSDGAIRSIDRQYVTAEKVLIIDAATVTGSVTRDCASELRAKGATWVGVAIFHRGRPDIDGLDADDGIDFVTSLT
jgi:hypothetical protein